MGCRESVVHIDVAEQAKLVDEGRIVLLLFLVEAEIFQQQHVAGFHVAHGVLGQRPDAVLGKSDRLAEDLLQRLDQRAQGHLRHPLAVGPTEVD